MFAKLEEKPFTQDNNFAPLRKAIEAIKNRADQLLLDGGDAQDKKEILNNFLQKCTAHIEQFNGNWQKTEADPCKELIRVNLLCDLSLQLAHLFLNIDAIKTLQIERDSSTKVTKSTVYAASLIGGGIAGASFGFFTTIAGAWAGHRLGMAAAGIKNTESIKLLHGLDSAISTCAKSCAQTQHLDLSSHGLAWDAPKHSAVLSWQPTFLYSLNDNILQCTFCQHGTEVELDVHAYIEGEELDFIKDYKDTGAPKGIEFFLRLIGLKAQNAKALTEALQQEQDNLEYVSRI